MEDDRLRTQWAGEICSSTCLGNTGSSCTFLRVVFQSRKPTWRKRGACVGFQTVWGKEAIERCLHNESHSAGPVFLQHRALFASGGDRRTPPVGCDDRGQPNARCERRVSSRGIWKEGRPVGRWGQLWHSLENRRLARRVDVCRVGSYSADNPGPHSVGALPTNSGLVLSHAYCGKPLPKRQATRPGATRPNEAC